MKKKYICERAYMCGIKGCPHYKSHKKRSDCIFQHCAHLQRSDVKCQEYVEIEKLEEVFAF